MELVDTHCHLDVDEFARDRGAVIARARAAGVTAQVIPGIEAAEWPMLREVCDAEQGLFAAYGLHPTFLASHRPEHLDLLEEWLEREKPVAVGECGLDFFVEGLDGDTQRLYFRRQLELAKQFDLPLVLHARRAVEEVIATLRQIGGLRGVVHSYGGSYEQAAQLWKLGFFLGFGGPITYERAHRLRGIVTRMPAEFLLLETDSPDQPLATHRGERNEPSYLPEVLRVAAALRDETPESLAAVTSANARRLFALP